MSIERRRALIEPGYEQLSVVRQCELVSISRSSFYYQPAGDTAENLALMRLIDAQFLETPWYGSRQMARHLRRDGHEVGRKRVRRLMALMGLSPIYQRPRMTVPHPKHRIYPYLLRGLVVDRPNQVWCTDITYIPMRRGFLYLVAVMDWATRKVLLYRLRTDRAAAPEGRAAVLCRQVRQLRLFHRGRRRGGAALRNRLHGVRRLCNRVVHRHPASYSWRTLLFHARGLDGSV